MQCNDTKKIQKIRSMLLETLLFREF